MLLIDRLSLDFAPGLNVLTGETGAGKSILLDCLGFVLGWRGRAELVRAGASQGEVTAVFDLPPGHPARAVLDEAGIEAEEELILRRVNAADGRKTGWVNDRRVSGEVLRALSDALVELHGQHDDRGLLNPRGHRMLLDAFGALGEFAAAQQVVERLGAIAHHHDFVGELAFRQRHQGQFEVVWIVFDQQDGFEHDGSGASSGRGVAREGEVEGGAVAFEADHRKPVSTQRLHDPVGDRQAQPTAAV